MDYRKIQQLSDEWWELKIKRIGGTRFGQLISGRENMLIDELANEALDNFVFREEYESDDMIFGTENEPIAIDMYEKRTGLRFDRGGVIISEINPNIHMASPDGISECRTKIIEVKCTQHGKIQVNRYRKGVDAKYMPQIVNYFAVSPEIQEVHWVSYCPYRPEIPIVFYVFTRNFVMETKTYKTKPDEITTIQDQVNLGLSLIPNLESELNKLVTKIKF